MRRLRTRVTVAAVRDSDLGAARPVSDVESAPGGDLHGLAAAQSEPAARLQRARVQDQGVAPHLAFDLHERASPIVDA